MSIKQMCQSASIYEAALNEVRNNIVKEIAERLSKVELPDVQRISSSPCIVIVKASTVFSNSWNMSAEYYITESQTKLLIEKISNKTTITEIKKFIGEVISKGYIEIHSRYKVFINSAVKSALIEILNMMEETNNA